MPPLNTQKRDMGLGFTEDSSIYGTVCKTVVESYHLELREITKFMRQAQIAWKMGRRSQFPNTTKEYILSLTVPIIIGLKISDYNLFNKFVSGLDYSPMLILKDALRARAFKDMLSSGESFSENPIAGSTIVTVDEKLKCLYEAIFGKDLSATKIGILHLDENLKDSILRLVSMLSSFADYHVS